MKIDFYFWGDQCPHNFLIRDRLKELRDNDTYNLNLVDISQDFKIAEDLNIYSPNLIIFDNDYRWNGPITMEIIRDFEKGIKPDRKPYFVEPSRHRITGELKPLTEDTVGDSYKPCAASRGRSCCALKAEWVKSIKDQYGLDSLGYLHYVKGECVGGAEFVPSLIVPYSIPRGQHSAFITCVFVSDEHADYRSHPLEQLEKSLPGMGFNEVLVIASEDVVFPNGPLSWFTQRGYEDQGVVNFEGNDHARMHLLKKKLAESAFPETKILEENLMPDKSVKVLFSGNERILK